MPFLGQEDRYWLAVGIISASFIIIGGMLGLQQVSVTHITTQIAKGNFTESEIKTILEEVNRSNANTINIILPVFAAWVGAVIAAYFSTEKSKKGNEFSNMKDNSNSSDNSNDNIVDYFKKRFVDDYIENGSKKEIARKDFLKELVDMQKEIEKLSSPDDSSDDSVTKS